MPGLYIHIPFCASKCAYCDFYSLSNAESLADLYDALGCEMEARRGFLTEDRLDTIYVGGGTPSLLSPEQLQGLLDKAAELWDCASLREATLEANPEDLTDDYISRLAHTGFNRVSIGIQSFDDSLLNYMNRRHSAQRAVDAVRTARKAGFENITIDLIYGIPGMTRVQWERTLNMATDLGIQHISAYHLTIEPGTAFGRSRLRPIPEAESEWQYETLRRKLGDAGFGHYEISNFALTGHRAIHNSAYWSGKAYLGIGPSAHSFDGSRRREWAVADIGKYVRGVANSAIYDGENLSDRDVFNERLMTSLRCTEGLDIEEMRRKFDTDRVAGLTARAEKFFIDGSLTNNGSNIAIPPEKFFLSDYIISSLFEKF